MQSSLTSDNYINPKFLARGVSLLARQLGHKNTNIFRASILALLEGGESPLSPHQLSMAEDVLTSPLGGRALSELNHVKFCHYEWQREQHEAAMAGLLQTTISQYASKPEETSVTIASILHEGKNRPVPPKTITSEKLWNTLMQRQKTALHSHRLRQLLESVRQGTTQVIDSFFDGETLHFDPQNLILGVVNEKRDAILGNDIVHGLMPTGKPGHLFSQHGERYVVCIDQQGGQNILNYSDRNMFWSFLSRSDIPPKFLDTILAENLLEIKELQTYTGKPIFFAHIKTSYGDEYVLAHTLNRMPQIGVGNLVMMNIGDDCILIHDNGSSGSFAGSQVVSIKTGQELEVRDSDGVIKMESHDGLICFDEARCLKFEGEKPNGKEFTETIGGWFGTREVRLSQLVQTWKKVALREAGKI